MENTHGPVQAIHPSTALQLKGALTQSPETYRFAGGSKEFVCGTGGFAINKHPQDGVDSPSGEVFKRRLDAVWTRLFPDYSEHLGSLLTDTLPISIPHLPTPILRYRFFFLFVSFSLG